jgi:PKD repeat protein
LGQYTLTGTIPAAPQPPVAVAGATPTSGYVPLAVQFSSAGSSDPDGTITSYQWSFADGGTSAQPNPQHSYTTAGNFNARLVVTDNSGRKATNTVGIAVLSPPGAPSNLRVTVVD